MGPAAAASHPRLAQLGRLEQAGGSPHVVSEVSGAAGAGSNGLAGSRPAVRGLLRTEEQQQQPQSGGADEQRAAKIEQVGEGGSASSSPDDGGVAAVGSRLRRVSWADDPGSGGAAGGALMCS